MRILNKLIAVSMLGIACVVSAQVYQCPAAGEQGQGPFAGQSVPSNSNAVFHVVMVEQSGEVKCVYDPLSGGGGEIPGPSATFVGVSLLGSWFGPFPYYVCNASPSECAFKPSSSGISVN